MAYLDDLLVNANVNAFQTNPEMVRFITYVAFWLMCLFAFIVTKATINEDIITHSALVKTFGYNNICVFWDYSPSREATSVVYEFVEMPLLVYSFLAWQRTYAAHRQQLISKALIVATKVLMPVVCLLLLQVHLIFTILAYVDIAGHTAGFLCLQVALVIIAILNQQYHHEVGTFRLHVDTSWVAKVVHNWKLGQMYIVLTCLVTFTKLTIDIYALAKSRITSNEVAVAVERIWMFLNAVVPMFLSYWLSRHTASFTCTLDMSRIVALPQVHPESPHDLEADP
jgi:hypothetical protein